MERAPIYTADMRTRVYRDVDDAKGHIRQLEARIKELEDSRLVTLTAAALTGLLANPNHDTDLEGFIYDAIHHADALIAALDTKGK